MSYFGSSLAPPSSGLTASNINTLIQRTLAAQRKPIRTLMSRKDTLTIEKAIYADLKSKLTTLKSITENLISTDTDTVFDDMSVTSDDAAVVTATATSSATSGKYAIDVTALAAAHRVRSDQATSSSDALNLAGTFTLNGASITVAATDSLEDVMASINAGDYGESLGFSVNSSYTTELDSSIVSDGLRADFAAQGITLSEDATVSIVTEDSRWLIIDHGKEYSVRDGGGQLDIYKGGRDVNATIVDNHLILEADSTGLDNALSASGAILEGSISAVTGLGILTSSPDTFKYADLQAAGDASFDVNGITITRSFNTGLDDVINGVTLNLLSVEKTDIEVAPDNLAIAGKITAFVNSINSTTSYLKGKTGTTVDVDNNTYTRGALSGKTIFTTLRTSLLMTLNEEITTGSIKRLSDIGITIGSGLVVEVDTTKLDSMLETNLDDVIKLFDNIMDKYLTILEPYTATSSSSNMLDLYSSAVETKMENIDTRVGRMEKMLLIKEELLITQYSGLYMQSLQLQSDQQGLLSIYASLSMYG